MGKDKVEEVNEEEEEYDEEYDEEEEADEVKSQGGRDTSSKNIA